MKHHLRFRQVHLDFHTAGSIPDVGAGFDPEAFAQMLEDAHVDSITCFSAINVPSLLRIMHNLHQFS